MAAPHHIVLIGCGKMGSALLQGWLDAKITADFSVIDPHDIAFNTVDHYRDIVEAHKALAGADAVILAVKPQIMTAVCSTLKQHLPKQALILSIAAGQSISSFQNHFGTDQPLIRTMPNTPAAIGKGMSVAVPTQTVTPEQKTLARTLLETAGKFEWLDDESLLDAVTALSGSGPAYVFLLIEILANAGEKSGLPADMAMSLARQTVIGAAALAESEAATPASRLRENVTSPGGTTEAALKILMDGRVQTLFDEALAAATARGKELNT